MYTYEDKKLEISPVEDIEGIECFDVVAEEFEEIKKLGEAMINYCVENSGLGLAAPQVGVKKNMFVWMNAENSFQIVMNPTFFPNKKKTNVVEGCLSYPGMNFFIQRYKEVRIKFFYFKEGVLKPFTKNVRGERSFIFQHEYDHLKGKTIATEGVPLSSVMEEDVTDK
jgi:peptide deformylase